MALNQNWLILVGGISSDYDERFIALEADNNSLKIRVKALEDSAIFENGIPDYVLAVRNADSFVMSLATDLHTNGTESW